MQTINYWSRGQKNGQQSKAPRFKKKKTKQNQKKKKKIDRAAGYLGPVKIELRKGEVPLFRKIEDVRRLLLWR